MGRLDEKVAIVTGAGRGVGRGVALAMAAEGARVSVVEIDEKTGQETCREIESAGGQAVAFQADVGCRADCEAAVARSMETWGSLDILVNNAAWTPTPGLTLMEFDDETFGRVLDTNLWSTFWMMQTAQPHLLDGGAIINFASGSGTIGNETQGAYAAGKEGVRGLSRVAAREWGPLGIRVNIICPFANSPGMIDWANLDREGYEERIETIPLRRVGDCQDDVGRVAVFLASEDAAYVTAQTMWVDGGSGSVR